MYRGLAPHKIMPMPGTHKRMQLTVIRQNMNPDRDTKKAFRWDAGLRASEPKVKVSDPEYSESYACLSCKTAHKRHIEGAPSDYPLKRYVKELHSILAGISNHLRNRTIHNGKK